MPTRNVTITHIPHDDPPRTLQVLTCSCGSYTLELIHVGNLWGHGAYFIQCVSCTGCGPIVVHHPHQSMEELNHLSERCAELWDSYVRSRGVSYFRSP